MKWAIIKLMSLKELQREKRDTAVTVRLPNSVVEQLKEIADKLNCSQSEVIEHLIKTSYPELRVLKKPK